MAGRPRLAELWPSFVGFIGSVLVLIGLWRSYWICFGVGLMIELVYGVWLLTRHEKEDPLSLSEKAKSEIGPLGKPEFKISLVDPGERKREVIRCLRHLYESGIETTLSLVRDTPSVLGMAVSKEEADFVASRLRECGAQIDIERVQE